MILRWFLSPIVRQAVDLRKQVENFLHAQRDILSTEAINAIETAVRELQATLTAPTLPEKSVIVERMDNLEKTANKWLKPYPNASMRENVEVVLVAIAVALGVRTFFLQPFKIPTGSMQPTLYGITAENHRGDATFQIPSLPVRFWDACFRGTFYNHLVADEECEFAGVGPVEHVAKFINKQAVRLRYSDGTERAHTLWFTPDDRLAERAGLNYGQTFHKGDDVVKMSETAGDHLFVDRVTYNFRAPKRGEIIVFETHGIRDLPQDQFYIKRMVALGGDQVRLGNDRHLVINGQKLDAATPHFENVYSFSTNDPPRDSHYSGHVNEFVARQNMRSLAPNFPNETAEYLVPPKHYLVMGDNTMSSYDSRAWGDFPQTNVIGTSFFVYWPFSSPTGNRFGWSVR